MSYLNVAAGINATVTAESTYSANNRSNNGSANGSVRINMRTGNSELFTLNLWDSTIGDGFEEAYDPGVDFSYVLTFYDIDGNSEGTNRDQVTIFTDSSYTLTTTTTIETTVTEDSVTFLSGDDTDNNVSGAAGLTSFTQEQADASVSVLVENSSEFVFEYTVVRNSGSGGRNLLLDASDLITALAPFETTTTDFTTTPVPLPASGAMMIAGLAVVGLIRRRKRANA